MSDPRRTPANGRVAATHLHGQVEAEQFTDGAPAEVTAIVANLRRAPDGARDRQLLLGTRITVFEQRERWCYVQSTLDGYVGYLRSDHLGSVSTPSHRVSTPATHAYTSDDMKTPELCALPFGARLTVTNETRKFFETPLGFVPKKHLRPLDMPFSDPVSVAQMFFGTPYLWGGNSIWGIDCSGLVQAGCLACGLPCPGDSDMQEAELGERLPDDAPLQRGDAVFWKGHVGWMVDEATLLHANAHAMAVAYEPFDQACLRIQAQGDGTVTARRRVSPPRG